MREVVMEYLQFSLPCGAIRVILKVNKAAATETHTHTEREREREGERGRERTQKLIVKDRSIWTYLTASPCYTTNTNKHDYTTRGRERQTETEKKKKQHTTILPSPSSIYIQRCTVYRT